MAGAGAAGPDIWRRSRLSLRVLAWGWDEGNSILARSDRFLTEQAHARTAAAHSFLRAYKMLAIQARDRREAFFRLTPKFHAMVHLTEEDARTENPRRTWR